MTEEKTVNSHYVYKGHILNLRIDTVKTADGQEGTREILEHGACVAVVPVDSEGNVLLVRQFRKAIEQELLEIPAGGIEPGEDPEVAVKRELQEEIGHMPGRIEAMGGFYSSPGFSTEYLFLYFADELTPARLFAEDTAGIETVRIRPEQVLPLIQSGDVCDAKSIAGLLLYLKRMAAKP